MAPSYQKLTQLELISCRDIDAAFARYIRPIPTIDRPLDILEAGCGKSWDLRLPDIDFVLTGIDFNEAALRMRVAQRQDLSMAIQGDLRTVGIHPASFDVIYSSYVLEHVAGAEQVMRNLVTWLRPGGLLLIKIPDPLAGVGFVTRVTPFWFHIFYKKYIQQVSNAGKPGHDPFQTIFDAIVSRPGLHQFCDAHGLEIVQEYGTTSHMDSLAAPFRLSIQILLYMLYIGSGGSLAIDLNGLALIIKKVAHPDDQPIAPLLNINISDTLFTQQDESSNEL